MTDAVQFRVLDFDCPTCASNVERALSRLDGVESVDVHYTTGRVEIGFDPEAADREQFEDTIKKQGYTPQVA